MEASLKNKIVVITGASSGNGKAAAIAFAKEGATVVLAARREHLLKELAFECERLGGKALAVRTDVTNFNEVKNLFEKAVSLNGRIDIWINNAGVLAFGEFSETPPEVSAQVIQTNLVGCIFGAHVAVPHFISQGFGTMINMNSLSAFVPTPFVAAYSASKIGLKGFAEALQYELSSFPDIHICNIYATFLNTPGLDHAANFSEKKLAPPPPLLDPADVAKVMIKLARRPKNSVTLGSNAYMGKMVRAILPHTLGVVLNRLSRLYLSMAPKASVTKGNLFTPVAKGTHVHGGWGKTGLKRVWELFHLRRHSS